MIPSLALGVLIRVFELLAMYPSPASGSV